MRDRGQRGRRAGEQHRQRPPAAQEQRRDDERREHGDRVPVRQPHAGAGEPEQEQPARRLLQPPHQAQEARPRWPAPPARSCAPPPPARAAAGCTPGPARRGRPVARPASRVTARVMSVSPPAVASSESTRSEVSPPEAGQRRPGVRRRGSRARCRTAARRPGRTVVPSPLVTAATISPSGSRPTSAVNSSSNHSACPGSSSSVPRAARSAAGEQFERGPARGPRHRGDRRRRRAARSVVAVSTPWRLGDPSVSPVGSRPAGRPACCARAARTGRRSTTRRAGRRRAPAVTHACVRLNSTSVTSRTAQTMATASAMSPAIGRPAAAPQQPLLVLLAEQHPVLGRRRDQQAGRDRGHAGSGSRRPAGSR